ncbi:conserved hypothetical protein [Methanocella paludicola SANAE]|uniref:Uncharacterized protein n=1 Tax=Methanocella paludicola (strain DSM 17711 / JCM 13418 / NBRC 101707 / SANAE) TaxID=304371 RepID=D1Z2V1_METPS|nr:hypothetical protein [Methanocella paludicola]BAI63023.1 conserved hypothetical protein [Methanocella paludicola SANAE]
MLKDDGARVPFAVIGVLLIFVSTAASAYLMSMQSLGVTNAVEDEREAELNDALACAKADIDSALNYACIYAEEDIGERPIVNSTMDPGEANLLRLERMAARNLTQYLDANYQGSFVYGDYRIDASMCGNVSVEPLYMNLSRVVYHPVLQCQVRYPAYYVASTPIRLHITRPGSTLDHAEEYEARTLVTSRYPLLESLTEEYEARLNGTVMLADATAASFAYTWARGYCQYYSGEPANIVDNDDLALIANAASLLEQGCEYNSVDPVSLASLVKHTYDNTRSTEDVLEDNDLSYINQYNFSNTSKKPLPRDEVPDEYSFNGDEIVDKALRKAIADPVSRYDVEKAYGCRMYVTVQRRAVSERYNDTGSICRESYPLASNENGTGPFFREVWKAWENDTCGRGWTEAVTIDYVMEDCSLLHAYNDVRTPHKEASYASGGRAYVDSNLVKAVDGYHGVVPVQDVLFDRAGYPSGSSGPTVEIACEHNEWVENASVSELRALAPGIKKGISVTLKASDYGSYDEMMAGAYGRMQDQFRRNYTAYLSEGDYRNDGIFRGCGAKYVFYKRVAFLDDIGNALDASANASEEVNKKIDKQLKDYSRDMNSSTLKDNARSSKSFLDDTKMFIPFGLNMTLAGGEGKYDPYKWEENVSLAIDQRPNYLYVDNYTDPETGYTVRPLKVRNVCAFALPTDVVDTGEATGAVLDGIDAVAGAAGRLANDTITAETSELVDNVSAEAKQAIKDEINDALVHDQDLQGQVTREDVNSSVESAFNDRTPGQAVRDMRNGTLQREIAGDLAGKAKARAESELAKRSDEYVDAYGDYIAGKAEEAILGAEERAVSYVISTLSDSVKGVFKDFMAEAADKTGDAAISAALKRIPMGLPLLPPWGWWATMNLWYIEIYGEIPYLAVYDTDSEPIPDPVLGQRATVYVRRPMLDIREGEIMGSNEPVRFHIRTCTFIVVPPGPQGIGDKLGGWDEKSPGFDEVPA